MDVCEMRDRLGWQRVHIDDAIVRRGEAMRCVECHGPVKPFRAYRTGTRAHFEHVVMNPGCSTKPRTFSGRPSRHPHALD